MTNSRSDNRWLKSNPETWVFDDLLEKTAKRIAPDVDLQGFIEHFRENAPDYNYSNPKRAFRNWLKREQAKAKSPFKTRRIMTYKQALQHLWNNPGRTFSDMFERLDRDGEILWVLKTRNPTN